MNTEWPSGDGLVLSTIYTHGRTEINTPVQSYGGYMTTKVIEANDGVFSTGMAVAPVTDWRFYGKHGTVHFDLHANMCITVQTLSTLSVT